MVWVKCGVGMKLEEAYKALLEWLRDDIKETLDQCDGASCLYMNLELHREMIVTLIGDAEKQPIGILSDGGYEKAKLSN